MVVSSIIFFGINLVAGIIPIIGGIAGFLITGPLLGGLYLVAFDMDEGKSFDMKRIFDGFNNFTSYFLVYAVSSFFIMIPLFMALVGVGVLVGADAYMDQIAELENTSKISEQALQQLLVYIPVALLPALIVSSWYIFPYAIIANGEKNFWVALEMSRKAAFSAPFKAFGYLMMISLINIAGFLLLFVGLLFTVPLSICITAKLTRNMFGGATESIKDPPPLPIESIEPSADFSFAPRNIELDGTTPGYAHLFILVERSDPTPEIMQKIASVGVPEAMTQANRPRLTGINMEQWPQSEQDLLSAAKQTVQDYIEKQQSAPPYGNPELYSISVWKGKDKVTGRNMAVVSVIRK